MLKDLGTVQAVSFSADPAHIARRFPPPWSVGDVDVEKKAKPPGCETDGLAFIPHQPRSLPGARIVGLSDR
jgi:hypothetical protein